MSKYPRGYSVTRLESAGSTNDEAKAAAQALAVDGTVIWTPHQAAGRGTHGRDWTSPPGNLAVSILKRPRMPMRFAAQAALVSAVALADALPSIGLAAQRIKLKWPNDVMVDGCKISGILVEGAAADSSVEWIVAGVGVNVLHHPIETRHPATNLADANVHTTPEAVLEAFLASFDSWWGRWRRYDFQVIATAWMARTQHVPGEMLSLTQGRDRISAVYKGLAVDGALVVEGEDGIETQITSGEIFATDDATPNEAD